MHASVTTSVAPQKAATRTPSRDAGTRVGLNGSGNGFSSSRFWRHGRPTILGLSSVVLLVLIWQVASSAGWVNANFLPGPVPVAGAFFELLVEPRFWNDLQVSGASFGIGLGLSIVLGTILGLLAGWYAPVEEFLRPVVVGMNSMPQIALIPVLILLFGTGSLPKIIVVILSCLPTIILNVAAGVMNVDDNLLRMSRSLRANQFTLVRTVVMPSIVPFFMTGIRISVGRAMIAVVVGEFFASSAGLGNLVVSAANSFNMPLMYATVVMLTLLGILLTQGAGWLERKMQSWKVQ